MWSEETEAIAVIRFGEYKKMKTGYVSGEIYQVKGEKL